MSEKQSTNNCSRTWFAQTLPAGLLVGGILVYFHATILTALGWAGGFRFLRKISLVYFAIGAVALVGALSRHEFDVRYTVVATIVSLPVILGGILLLPSGDIFSNLGRFLLYGSVAFAFPLGVAHDRSQEESTYLLLGVVCVVWVALTGLVLQSAPRGPIGLYLVWNFATTLVFAVPVYLTGRVLARPVPEQ